jgi:hypothetical protein
MTYQEIYSLRESVYKAAGEFYRAQIDYTNTVLIQRPMEEKRAAAELGLVAANQYAAALDSYLWQFSQAEPFPEMKDEILYILKLANIVCREQNTWSTLLICASPKVA